jgi:hypothetical protein
MMTPAKTAPGNKDSELTMNRANIGGAGEIKRGAAYARDKINTLLVSLHTEHTSGRQKALRKFEDYFFTFRPNLLEGDARALLEGDALRRGLVQECGAMSENHVGELKKTGVEVSVGSHNMNYITHPPLPGTIASLPYRGRHTTMYVWLLEASLLIHKPRVFLIHELVWLFVGFVCCSCYSNRFCTTKN